MTFFCDAAAPASGLPVRCSQLCSQYAIGGLHKAGSTGGGARPAGASSGTQRVAGESSSSSFSDRRHSTLRIGPSHGRGGTDQHSRREEEAHCRPGPRRGAAPQHDPDPSAGRPRRRAQPSGRAQRPAGPRSDLPPGAAAQACCLPLLGSNVRLPPTRLSSPALLLPWRLSPKPARRVSSSPPFPLHENQ